MTRYKITVEYDGTDLIGWQENRQGPSVQSILRDAVEKFCGARPDIVAAGRTDAGVHAIAMVAHFDLDEQKNPETVMRAMNFYFSCVRRNYRYVVLNRGARPVLEKNRVWWVPRKLNMSAMRCAAEKLVGHHDFTSFRASECQAKSPIKTLDSCTIKRSGEYIIFEFSARSFLHHQVRNMVGTLVEIGLGKPYDIDEIFAAKNRSAAGPTAPASGLFFVSADYATDDCGEQK